MYMFKTNQPKETKMNNETIKEYHIKTFGFKNNYTCIMYKVLDDQFIEVKKDHFKTSTLNQAFQKFKIKYNLKQKLDN